MVRSVLVFGVALCAILPALADDPGQTHVVYQVTVKAEGPRHYAFSIDVTRPNQDELVFVVPHWAPGAYREITVGARGGAPSWKQLANFRAVDGRGRARKVTADGPRRWKVDARGAEKIVFSYKNTNPGTPRNNRSYLGARSGLIDGPRNWMYIEGKKDLPVHVHFDLPEGWEIGTGLDPTFDPRIFTARDYDRLADCPTLVGHMKSWMFNYRGVPHRVVVDAGARPPRVDAEEFLDMVQRVVKVYVDMFDDVPYEHYTFIYTPGGGGLEHLNSTTIGGLPRLTARSSQGVTAHEFFHTWNVKRLRPKRLGPFDYTGPQPVDDLWIAEGLTSYYTPLGLWRAGLYQDQEFLERQRGGIRSWESNPAHLVQSPQESSRAVWTGGTRISYYLQGQVLGMMIDLLIRQESDNQWSLDDVMRAMYRKYGGYYRWKPSSPGYESEDWPREIAALTGVDVGGFWDAHIRDSQPVDWNRYLGAAGWKLLMEYSEEPALAGIRSRRVTDARGKYALIVTEGEPAWKAGFRDGDIIESLNERELSGRSRVPLREFRRLKVGSAWKAKVKRGSKTVMLRGKVESANEFQHVSLDERDGGLVVGAVPGGTSLWAGGLRSGDVVTSIDGAAPGSPDAVNSALRGRADGEEVVFGVRRGGKDLKITVKTAAWKVRRVTGIEAATEINDRQKRIRHGMKTGATDRQ